MTIGMISLQISSFECIHWSQFCYSASAIATLATTATPPTTTREGLVSSAADSLSNLANFFVDSFEFSKKHALSTSTNLTKVRQSQGVRHPASSSKKVSQIKNPAPSFPLILTCGIEENLEAKMNHFLELGISVSDFADIISSQPKILDCGMNSSVCPTIEALREAVGSNENMVRVIKKFKLKSLWEKEALSTSTKLTKWRQYQGVTKVCATDFHRNAELVIRFLEQKGFEKPQIRKMVSGVPRILICKVEANLEAKMNYFLELGFSTSDIADVVSVHDRILSYGLDSTIRPAIEALRTVMGSVENLLRVMKGLRFYYVPLIPRHFVQNVSFLQALGIPTESIRKRIVQLYGPLMQKPETLKGIVARAEAKWGVSRSSNMFFYAVDLLCRINEENLDSKCRVFESFGWDRSDVVLLFRSAPFCLMLSEGNIKAKLRFYMSEMGYDVGFIRKRPVLLSFSWEKRVWPRHLVLQILKDRALVDENVPLFKAVTMTESKFLRQYIQPFEDAVPNLHHIYVNSISSSAQQEIKSFIKSEIEA
ncbi:hypothetical protein Cgig2_018700 [Carnegiea gigantea]|uniref:Uncharacterized protein n=1 Tax=Carnegiea gigantea TaxID=171969 RepID=A0A9Q1QH82_9CARY|nr:hypothetical protein Cgig2_018700 [Carnegiea gigantea]